MSRSSKPHLPRASAKTERSNRLARTWWCDGCAKAHPSVVRRHGALCDRAELRSLRTWFNLIS